MARDGLRVRTGIYTKFTNVYLKPGISRYNFISMDPIKNPFSPGAGSPPPELVGRDPILEQARILLGRIKAKRPEKSMLLTGLRGVGKTVLLNEIERLANADGYRTLSIEAHEDKPLEPLIAPYLRTLLYDLNPDDWSRGIGQTGLAVLRSFVSALKVTVGDVSIGLDIELPRKARLIAVTWRLIFRTSLSPSPKRPRNGPVPWRSSLMSCSTSPSRNWRP